MIPWPYLLSAYADNSYKKKEYVSQECACLCTMAINADSLAQLRDILVKSKRFVFLTGAGISQESGIPTFRGNDGLWKTPDPAKLTTLSSFLEYPSLVYGGSTLIDKN